MKYLTLLFVLFVLAGCASTPYLYYGDSSYRYYQSVKHPNDLNQTYYKVSLEHVFDKSARLGIKVPPGLYCDYALLMLRRGDALAAREYLLKEKDTWTESASLVDFLLAKHGLRN